MATRGLKAVRYQKFQNHLRLRPEALAGRLARVQEIEALPEIKAINEISGQFSAMASQLTPVMNAIRAHNLCRGGENLPLLPMAFQEGSPMHPAYGAGHATVAGACVTVLKAFFNTKAELRWTSDGIRFLLPEDPTGIPVQFLLALRCSLQTLHLRSWESSTSSLQTFQLAAIWLEFITIQTTMTACVWAKKLL